MMRMPTKQLHSRTVLYGLLALFGTSFLGNLLPIWTVWHINDWEGLGVPGNLWSAVWQLPSNLRNTGPDELLTLHSGNLWMGSVTVFVSVAVGVATICAVHWREVIFSGRR